MLQTFYQQTFAQVGHPQAWLTVLALALAVLCWAGGSAVGRGLVGLIGVLVGATAGIRLPEQLGWTIGGAGPAVALGLIVGLCGFLLPRALTGIGLGLLLAGWTGLMVLSAYRVPPVPLGELASHSTWLAAARGWFQSVPEEARTWLTWAPLSVLAGCCALAIFLPRFCYGLFWSTLGVSLAGVFVYPMVVEYRAGWLVHVPALPLEAMILCATALFGAVFQYALPQPQRHGPVEPVVVPSDTDPASADRPNREPRTMVSEAVRLRTSLHRVGPVLRDPAPSVDLTIMPTVAPGGREVMTPWGIKVPSPLPSLNRGVQRAVG